MTVTPLRSKERRSTAGPTVCLGVCLLALAHGPLPCAQAETESPAPVNRAAPPGITAPGHGEALFAAPTRRDRIGRVVVPVMVNGRGPFRFVLDTGANRSVLSSHLAAALGLVIDPDAQLQLEGTTGSAAVPFVQVTRMETGDVTLDDLQLPVLDALMVGVDGVLGVEGFANKRILVDFGRDQIRIVHSHAERAPTSFFAVPARFEFGRLLIIGARVGGLPVHAVLDTGAERTLGNRALQRALRIRTPVAAGAEPPSLRSVVGMTPDTQHGNAHRVPGISMGDARVLDVAVTFGDFHIFQLWHLDDAPALIIGMDIIGVLDALVIDYRRPEIYIRPKLTSWYVNTRS